MTRREVLCAAAGAALGMGQASDRGDDLPGLIEPIRARHDLPALAAATIVNGRPAQAAAVGVRKYGDATPVAVTDRFHLGSCTKAMTAALIGMLVEEGKLSWDARLPDVLPSVADAIHADLRSVTVDHLLAHRSGLSPQLHPRPSLPALIEGRKNPEAQRRDRLAFIERALRNKPDTEPGKTYAYCNVGYMILGAIAELAMDAPWEILMRRRIFGPLGITTGGFGAMGSPGKVDEPWQHRIRDGKPVPVEPGAFSDNPPELGPAGTAHVSVGDWAKFLAAVATGERQGGKLLKPATWKRLLTPQFGGNYAGGWIVTERAWAGRALTHAGSNTMNFCVAWLAPDKGFGVGVMTNIAGEKAPRGCDETAAAVIGRVLGAGS